MHHFLRQRLPPTSAPCCAWHGVELSTNQRQLRLACKAIPEAQASQAPPRPQYAAASADGGGVSGGPPGGAPSPPMQTSIHDSISYSTAERSARLYSMRSVHLAGRQRRQQQQQQRQQQPQLPPPLPPVQQPIPPEAGSPSSRGSSGAAPAPGASPAGEVVTTIAAPAALPPGAESGAAVAAGEATRAPAAPPQPSSSDSTVLQPWAAPAGPQVGSASGAAVPGVALRAAGSVPPQQGHAGAAAAAPAAAPAVVPRPAAGPPRTVDIRMYDQIVAAQERLNQRLVDNSAARERASAELCAAQEDVAAAYELIKQITMEFGSTMSLASSAASAVRLGTDPQDAVDRSTKLQDRLASLEQAVLEQRRAFAERVVRRVPVEWTGVACEVRVMGDFDGWTRGQELCAEDEATDSVFSSFVGELMLRPGTYRVKFLVDDEWRLAGSWPTADDGTGNMVNLLTVAPDA